VKSTPSTSSSNNAGVAIYDDLSNLDAIEQHPGRQSLWSVQGDPRFLAAAEALQRGIVNNLSLVALAPLPVVPRLLNFEGGRVQHDAVAEGDPGRSGRKRSMAFFLGPVDTK